MILPYSVRTPGKSTRPMLLGALGSRDPKQQAFNENNKRTQAPLWEIDYYNYNGSGLISLGLRDCKAAREFCARIMCKRQGVVGGQG